MSTLLAGPKTEPWGVYQFQTETLSNKIRGDARMNIEMVLLIVILTFGIGFALNWWFDTH
jgi:hypothetical protein